MIVIGEKEQQENMISVRARDARPDEQDMGLMMVKDFVAKIKKDCK